MGKKAKKIISIDIELEDFEPIHLKMDEARELYEQLHDLFGEKDVHYHYPWYQQPYYYFTSTAPAVTTIDWIGATSTTTIVSSNNTGMQVTYNAA